MKDAFELERKRKRDEGRRQMSLHKVKNVAESSVKSMPRR